MTDPLMSFDRVLERFGKKVDQIPGSHDTIDGAGGDNHGPGMESRVTRLEEWAKQSEQRMARIEEKLDQMVGVLSKLPTRGELFGNTATVGALAFAVVALVAAIFAYRQDTLIAVSDRAINAASATVPAAVPQPIIIQMPQQQAPPAEPAKK